MPNPCFSYTADGTLGATNRSATQRTVPGPRQMPVWACFSYPADQSPGSRNDDIAQAARRGLREMPYPCYSYPNMCFSYPDDASWSTPGQDAVPALRRMPYGTCFRY